MKYKKLLTDLGLLPRLIAGILSGILLGLAGSLFHIEESSFFIGMVRVFSTFTSLFSTFLSFMIPLLILSFVTVGLAELGKKANRLFGITLLIAYASTVIAGLGSFLAGRRLLPHLITAITGKATESRSFPALFTISAEPVFGVMTALLLSFILGLGLANTSGKTLFHAFTDLQNIVKLILVKIIIPLIPVHIAGMFLNITASKELFSTIQIFMKLFLLIIVFQGIYILLQYTAASIICRENKLKQLKNVIPAYMTALGTQSSASTIPVSLTCAEKNGISEDIADFVIPLGATIHLAGDTICLVLGAMGILLANGITPTLDMFLPYILMLGITMVAAPGIPGGGVMAALGLLSSLLSFTAPMQQLMISLHLSQDSFGTACNVAGDQAIAMIIGQFDQKTDNENVPVESDAV